MKRLLLVFVLVVACVATGCAARLTPLQQVQATHDALATAQDLEAQLCWGVATVTAPVPDRSRCTTAIATTVGLTDARHQALNAQLATAFTVHKAVTAQLRAGTAADLTSLRTIIAAILALIGELRPAPLVERLATSVKAGEIRQ